MIVRELLTVIGYRVDETTEKRATSSIDRLKNAAKVLGGVFITGVVAQSLRQFVEMASDVEETMNVVTTAFEDQADSVLQWARVTGEAVGRSEYSLREYAATLGAVVGPTLGSADATAKLSTDMAQLAVDLGSFFNATDDDALQALRSALVGQSEPMLRFGVAMNVAALDAFALEQGLGKTTRKMTEAEKITLRYRFIMAQTAKAQGDAARTSGGLANQQKRLDEQIKTIQVDIGKQLLPIQLALVKSFNELAKALKGPIVSGFRLVASTIRGIGQIFAALGEGIRQMPADLKIFAGAFLAALIIAFAPGLLVVGLLGLIGFAIMAVIDDLLAMGEGGDSVIGGLIGEFQRWYDETGSIFSAISQVLKTAVDFWIEYFTGISNATDKSIEQLKEWESQFVGIFVEAFVRAYEAIREFNDVALQAMLDAFGFVSDKFAEIMALAERFAGTVGRLASEFGIDLGFGGPRPSPAGAAAGAGGTNVTAPQNIEVVINSGNASPERTAELAGRAVGTAGAAANRRLQQQIRVGGNG